MVRNSNPKVKIKITQKYLLIELYLESLKKLLFSINKTTMLTMIIDKII